jgi:hypothetical protein
MCFAATYRRSQKGMTLSRQPKLMGLSQRIAAINFTRWYIEECERQKQPCDGVAYDLPDAYADWVESLQ